MTSSSDIADQKRAAREWFRARRKTLTAADRSAAAAALTRIVAGLKGSVAAYVPVGSEPGNMEMLAALPGRVILPVAAPEPGPLDWAELGELVPGPFGLLEPAGRRLGSAAVETVDTVLVPALAVSAAGVRLGRGAGYYDRSLRPGPKLIAVVYDHELVKELPAETTDVAVHAVLTPSGLVELKTQPEF